MIAVEDTAPERPAARAKGTVSPSAMPMTMSRTRAEAEKCFSRCGAVGMKPQKLNSCRGSCRAGSYASVVEGLITARHYAPQDRRHGIDNGGSGQNPLLVWHLQRRKLSQPFNCDLIVRPQRDLIYKLSGAIHQIYRRCVVHRVGAFFERDAFVVKHAVCLCHGGNLLVGSGESAYARVEGREILLQVRRSIPLRIDRNEQDVELVGIRAERVEPGGQFGEGRGAESRTRCVTEKDHAGFAGKSFVRHFYPVLIDQFKRTEDGHAFGL